MKRIAVWILLIWGLIGVNRLILFSEEKDKNNEEIKVKFGQKITVDGSINEEEWNDAIELETTGAKIFLKHDEENLFIGIRSEKPGNGTIFVPITTTIYVLHASQALAEAIYQKDKDEWKCVEKYNWYRDKKEFAQKYSWYANTIPEGPHMEFCISYAKLGIESKKINPEDEKTFPSINLAITHCAIREKGGPKPIPSLWPKELKDDTTKMDLLMGWNPSPLKFEPEKWGNIILIHQKEK